MDDSEIIGAVGVSITGDYSSLQAAFSDAQSKASQAGGDVADAFNRGVAGVSDAGQTVTTALSGIGPAGDQAAAGLTDFSGATQQAASSSEQADSSLKSMAEQLTAIGEALIITEGLREFGSSALEASDSITRASIALTTMTGSGETAKTTIEGLEQLGMQDGLAMPSLLTAAQRMTALLPPGTDVVTVMGQIADGAAAMGTDIESAANRFDMIVNAGTLSARALTSLGLSLTSVAAAMNQVNPAANVTEQSVTAMFKALDPGQRVQVLQDALTKLAGTAQQVAEQTFGGQWQQLANAWEQVMVQVGNALLPVIADLVSFTKTDILPFVKELATDFNSLPGPLKDAAVAVGLAAAAAVPLTGALAAAGLAVSGLEGLMPAITGMMAAFGGTTAIVASQETAQATATTALGISAAAAVPEVEALAVAETQLSLSFTENLGAIGLVGEQLSLGLVPAIEAAATGLAAFTTDVGGMGLALMASGPIIGLAVLSIASLKDGYNQAKATLDNVSSTASGVVQKLDDLSGASTLTGKAVSALKTAWSDILSVFEQYNVYSLAAQGINKVTNEVQILSGVTPHATDMLKAMNDEIAKLEKTGVSAAVASVSDAISKLIPQLTPLQTGIANVAVAADKNNQTLKEAQAVYDALKNSIATSTPIYNGQVATTQELAIAYADLKKAADQAGVSLPPLAGSLADIAKRTQDLIDTGGKLASSQQIEAATTQAQSDKLTTLSAALISAQEKLVLTGQAQDTVAASAAKGTASQGDLNTAMTNTVAAADAVTKAQTAFDKAMVQAATDSQALADTQSKALLTSLQSVAAAMGPALAQFTGLDQAIGQLQETMPGFGIVITSVATGPLAGLKSALTEASAKVADLAAKMANGANVGQQYEKALKDQLNAQVALDEESAVLATGLQGATDAFSLAQVAVAAAQAKVDDLTAAYANGLATYSQVQSAQKALESAQKALNQAISDGNPLIVAQSSDLSGLLVPALGSTVTAANAAATAIQAVGTAAAATGGLVSAMAADMKALTDAFGATGSGGGGGAAPAGYQWQFFGQPGITQQTANLVLSPTATPNEVAAHTGVTPGQVMQTWGLPDNSAYYDKPLIQIAALIQASGVSGTSSTSTSSSTSSTSSTIDQSPIIIGSPIGGGATTSSTSTSSTTSTSQGVDGGVYPDVTAHQAVGEIWTVQIAGSGVSGASVAAAGGVSQQVSSTINETVTGGSGATAALQGTSEAIGGLVQTLGQVAESVASVAQAVATKAVAGTPYTLSGPPGGTNTSTGLPGVVGGSGTAYPGGAPPNSVTPYTGGQVGTVSPYYSVTPAPAGPVFDPFTGGWLSGPNQPGVGPQLPTAPGPGTYGPNGQPPTANVSININGAGMNNQQLATAILPAVIQGVVQATRAAGARY